MTQGPPPSCLPQGSHHPRSTTVHTSEDGDFGAMFNMADDQGGDFVEISSDETFPGDRFTPCCRNGSCSDVIC